MYNCGKSKDLMFAVNSKVPAYFKVDMMQYLTGIKIIAEI